MKNALILTLYITISERPETRPASLLRQVITNLMPYIYCTVKSFALLFFLLYRKQVETASVPISHIDYSCDKT